MELAQQGIYGVSGIGTNSNPIFLRFPQLNNKCTTHDSYPLPKIEDLYAKLSGVKIFSSLYLRHAYAQLPLAAESRKL